MQKLFPFRGEWFRAIFLSSLIAAVAFIPVNAQTVTTPTSISPGKRVAVKRDQHFKVVKKQKPARHKKSKVQHTAQYEFYARVEEAAKEKQRILKELAKPQYSNFKNFGHKRIPKKRPPHKMRYCEDCGIRH